MAQTFEQAAQDALNQQAIQDAAQQGMLNLDTSWQQAGQNALDPNGHSLGGSLGDNITSTMSSGGGGLSAYSTNGQAFDPTQWGAVGSSAVSSGGGNFSTSSPGSYPSPFPGTRAGGGGGGGGSSSSSAPPQQPTRPPTPQMSYSGASSGGSGILGLLGPAISSLLNRQTPQTGAPNLGINIPGIGSIPNVYSPSSQAAGSSFGGLQSAPQTFNASGTPSSYQADNSQMSLGPQKGASNPMFGGIGNQGSNSGMSGNGFAGSPPTPYQLAANGQMQQPGALNSNAQANPMGAAAINPAIGSMLSGSGIGVPSNAGSPAYGLGSPQSNDVTPGMAPIAKPGSSPGGPNNSPPQISAGVVGQNESSQASNGAQTASMKVIVDPTNPSLKYTVPDKSAQPAKVVTDPDNPDLKYTIGRSAIEPASSTPTPPPEGGQYYAGRKQMPKEGYPGYSVQRDFVEPAGKALVQGAKNVGLNIMNTLAYPFQDDKTRAAVNAQMAKDNAQTAADTADHPQLYAIGRTAGEVIPWVAATLASKGALAGAAVQGAWAASQPGSGTEKIINGVVGSALGGAFNAPAKAIQQGVKLASAVGGAYSGYKTGGAISDNPAAKWGGAALGALTGFTGAKVAEDYGITGKIMNFFGIGAKPAAQAVDRSFASMPEVQSALSQVGGAVTKDSPAAAKAAQVLQDAANTGKDAWHAANPSLNKSLFDSVAEQKAAINELIQNNPNKPALYGAPHPNAQQWVSDRLNDPEWLKSHANDPNVALTLAAQAANKGGSAAMSNAAQSAFSLAGHAATRGATSAVDAVGVGKEQKPPAAIKSFTHPEDNSPAAVQAHATTPMVNQVAAPVAKAISSPSSYKDAQSYTSALKIMSQSPEAFAKDIQDPDTRNKLLDIAYKDGGIPAMKQLQAQFNTLDGVRVNEAKNVNEAVAQQIQLAQTGKGPGYTPGQGLTGPSVPVQGQPAGGVPGAAIGPPKAGITPPGPAQTFAANPVNQVGPDGRPVDSFGQPIGGPQPIVKRAGYVAAGKGATSQKSAIIAQIMSLVMSYLMSSGRMKSMMAAGGGIPQAQLVGMLPSLLQSR